MCSIERGTNIKGAMRAGGKMVKMVKMVLGLTINISSEMIGIGSLILPSETEGLTTTIGNFPEKMPATHCRITTQCWVLTGESIACGRFLFSNIVDCLVSMAYW